ncbi:MAG: hypothetical protein SOX69_08300, partial [Oscillospiraceae bacterium]|nr:hypothetical protein [Oscillospiraceae bacterium]
MDEKISAFLTDVIPNEIPKRRRRKLVDELSCHIEDKADAFREIGYSDEDSVSKALEAFAETDEIKNAICEKFDELYHEKTLWAVIAGAAVAVMNLLSFPLDIWINSADHNDDPSTYSAAVSFTFVLAVISLIVFAKAKKYNKMLLGIACGVALTAILPIMNLYAQAAVFAVVRGTRYLVNEYTPLFIPNSVFVVFAEYYTYLLVLPLVEIAVCIVSAVRIKHGKTTSQSAKRVGKRFAVFSVCYACIAAFLSYSVPAAVRYENYPRPFDKNAYMSYASERAFDEIADCGSVEECDKILRRNGLITIDDFRKKLGGALRKELDRQIKDFQIPESFIVYVMHDSYTADGNGFIFLKEEDGRLTLKGVGSTCTLDDNIFNSMPNGSNTSIKYETLSEFFTSLKKGQPEQEITEKIENMGEIYSIFRYGENMNSTAYRVYFRDASHPDDCTTDFYEAAA